MVSARMMTPISERFTWISWISCRTCSTTSSRLPPRMTRRGDPAMTPSSFGAATLMPAAAVIDLTRSNRSSIRISFMGRGFKRERTFVSMISSFPATTISSPTARVPS